MPAGMSNRVEYLGLDFGTSNIVAGWSDPDRSPSTFRFKTEHSESENFPTLLHVQTGTNARRPEISAGPWALEAYLQTGTGRLIQSIKSFVATRSFTGTRIAGRQYDVEDLIGLILRIVREKIEGELGPVGHAVWAGRPVRFAGAKADEALALDRLRAAYAQAGWTDVTFVLEPVAAAYHYGREIDTRCRIVVADLGAGTSDFSVLEAAPATPEGQSRMEVLATTGVGIAGDNFDARIVQHVLAPEFGSNTHYTALDGKQLPMPRWLFSQLARWHHVSFLKSPETLRLIRELRRTSDAPDKLDALHDLIEHDLAFNMYRAVSGAKIALSQQEEAHLALELGSRTISRTVRRRDFERWIAEDISRIETTLDGALAQAAVSADSVSRVFMTGGTSYVPAVRRLFERRFGAERLVFGDAFVSVARGLAVMAARGSSR